MDNFNFYEKSIYEKIHDGISLEQLIDEHAVDAGMPLMSYLKKIGLSPTTYYAIRKGERPRSDVYIRLGRAFGVKGSTLLYLPINQKGSK